MRVSVIPSQLGGRLDRPHVGEAVAAQALGVLGLAEHRDVLRQQLCCRVVEVVEVHVRDQHGIDPGDHHLGRLRQFDQRIAPVIVRVFNGGTGTGRVEHRVDEQLPAGELEPQRRVADQAQVHWP